MIAFLALGALAQSPDDAWRTIRTDHFRVHYPVAAEAWAEPMARHLESIRAEVVEEVGYDPPQIVPIIVMDPATQANGGAIPLLHAPRMMFFTTPPEASSVLANYGRFDDVLSVHENAHVVHMLRPSRNPLVRVLDEWSTVGPITRKAPRWVIEGYATVVEARITGFGRPHSDARAQTLRTLAREGRLPTYVELDGNARWGGYGDAYFVGSAFLEWLEARQGEGSLRALWGRMSAKTERSFDVAFSGLFGDSPYVLYSRFSAELTAEAVAAEDLRPEVAGDLFVDLSRTTSTPALSADGSLLAAVVTKDDDRTQLMIWRTEVDTEAGTARDERATKRAARDPEDAPDSPPKAPPHEVFATRTRALRQADSPRFLPDGRVLFAVYRPDGEGRVRPDLYVWTPKGGERRLTRHQDVASPAPSPDGTWAIGVRKRFGTTELVRVELSTGDVTTFYAPAPGHVVDRPRVGPDGVLWLENSGSGFALRRAASEGTPVDVVLPGDASIVDATFGPDGAIYATLGRGGFVDVYRLGEGGAATPLTRSHNGTHGVEVGADALYLLGHGADGLDLRRVVPVDLPALPLLEDSPVFRVPVGQPREPLVDGPIDPKRYGVGPVEFRLLPSGIAGRGSAATAFLLRLGDPIGRWEAIGSATWAVGAPSGARGTLEWRGLPLVDLRLGAFYAVDAEHGRSGFEGDLSARHRFETAELRLSGGLLADRPLPGDPLDPRWFGYGEALATWSEGRTSWLHAAGRAAYRHGRTGEDLARMLVGEAALSVGPYGELEFRYSAGGADGPSSLDRFVLGGVQSAAAPEAWQWHRLTDPLVAPVGSTPLFDAMGVSVYMGGVELFAQRYRQGYVGLEKRGSTVGGARIQIGVEEQPLLRMPALDLDLGLGCSFETPEEGLDLTPCDQLGDYTIWSGVTFRP